MQILEILKEGLEQGGSDLFLLPGSAPCIKTGGHMELLPEERLSPADSRALIEQIYSSAGRGMDTLDSTGDDDFSFSVPGLGRFRCNAYKQRSSLAAVIRIVPFGLPDSERMHIPQTVMDLYKKNNGLVLVTGPAGSGKSTTLACLIDRINRKTSGHIITLEDPIEYVHSHAGCLVSQREISLDTESYASALRAALRQTPSVILLGEMRDFETIQTALTAAETGQLVLSTLHTVGAAKTIDRVVDVFPAHQQAQIRIQLSMVLQAVVSQQLLPGIDDELHPAFEIMLSTPAIQNMIREGKTHQLDNVIFSGADMGMRTMDGDILRLFTEGKISRDVALSHATDPVAMARKI